MITYRYKCENCGSVVEEDKEVDKRHILPNDCPLCGKESDFTKLIEAPQMIGEKGKGNWGKI